MKGMEVESRHLAVDPDTSALAQRSDAADQLGSRSPRQTLQSVSVVIPVYNSEAILPELVTRLERVLSNLQVPHEIVCVNDGSRDRSWVVLCDLAASRPKITALNLMRNYGQHNALLAGIRAARYEVIVTMDDDLQHPPEQISTLLAKLDEGWDVVYGKPETERHGLWRDVASQITKLVLRGAMGSRIAQDISAFRAIRSTLRQAFDRYRGPFVSIDVLLTWGTDRFASVRVPHDYRRSGSSNYGFRKLITYALNLMTGFSTLPLQVASLVGFAFTFVGVVLLSYVIGRYLVEGGSVPGFPFLASVIIIFSGAQLFALGIMGEYLARMHFRAMDRPAYAIRERIGPPQDEH